MSGSKSKRETGKDRAKPEGKSLLGALGGLDRYQKVNVLFIAFFSLSTVFNLLKANEEASFIVILPLLIFIVFFLILLLIGASRGAMRTQVIVLLFISYFTIVNNQIDYQAGYILLIFVYFLSQKYSLFIRFRFLYYFILGSLLILSVLISLLNYSVEPLVAGSELTLFHVSNQLLLVLVIVSLIYIVFEEDIKRLTIENNSLNTQIEKSSIFIDLGENISGLMHNMNGDLGLISMSVSMLEEDIDHKAVGYIKTGNKKLQAKIRNILTLAKYSQAEQDMEFSINALLYSLLEVFNINEEYTKILTSTDFQNEVFFYGNPSEISQVFENLIKNAYEALIEKCNDIKEKEGEIFEAQLKVSIIGTKEYSRIIFSDNGPGIKACLDKKCKGDCINCSVFRVGRTTKSEGTGLGMVSVMRTLDKYKGQLNIKTSTEGSIITVSLLRG